MPEKPDSASHENLCPECSKPLPAGSPRGLCPACLLKCGLEPNTIDASAGPAARWTPPTVEQLGLIFPELDILELIGRGGMGAVYKAREKQLDRLVALKILPPEIGKEKSFAERFAREAQAMAKLSHPNIVTIHSFGHVARPPSGVQEATDAQPGAAVPQLYFFIMEYVDGLSLRQLLDAGGVGASDKRPAMNPKEALAIVPQICDALQYAHDRGIVHRDIKPENILLNRAGQVKIADFGLAKLVASGGVARPPSGAQEAQPGAAVPQDSSTAQPVVTQAGEKVMGTPQYMAPEQIERPREVDHRADIYSLGVVFYQMLTGELPKGSSSKEFEPPSRKVLIDVRLDEVVLRALEREPARRYQQVSEVRTQVETIVSSRGGQSPIPAPQQVRAVPVETWHKYVAVVGRREGKAVINWRAVVIDGIIMAYLFALGLAIAHVLNPHRELNVWLALLVGLALLSAIPIAIYLGLKRPIERLTPLEPLPSRDDASPQMSRLAIIGAAWAGFGLLGLLLMVIA